MKKLLVIGIVATMVMGLAVAASAAFVKDADWAVYMQAGNTAWNATTRNWGSAATEIKMGDALAATTANGTSFVSSVATVRNMGSPGSGSGLNTDLRIALDQIATPQEQVWSDIKFFVGPSYPSTSLVLRIWGVGIDPNGPTLKLEVTQAATGSGFAVGDVIFDSSDSAKNLITNASKQTPSLAIDLSQYLAFYKTTTVDGPAVTFKLTAITPGVPEPGSMVALLSGLVGLVGFGIRRRK